MGIAEIESGNPEQLHLHRHEPAEAYYVLSGSGYVSIDGTMTNIRAGSAVFVPSNSLHAVGNTGPETLRLLYVFGVNSFQDVQYVFPD
jgi:mannose-6-phosphate isomerase-like protein (cupin superfamily)